MDQIQQRCLSHRALWKRMSHVFGLTQRSLRTKNGTDTLWTKVIHASGDNICIKLGPNPRVRTQDRYPIRESHVEKGVPWSNIYPNWAEMEQECLELNKHLNKHSKFLIFLGHDNYTAFRNLLALDSNQEVALHTLNRGIKFYNQPFRFAVVRHKQTREVQQVIWFSYHLQHFFYNYRESVTRYFHDFLWSGICELAGIAIVAPFCFSQSSSSAGQAAMAKSRKHGILATALQMRMYEKGTGTNYPEKEIRHIFRVWINNSPNLSLSKALPHDESGSFLAPLLRLKSSQGGKTAGPMNIGRLHLSNSKWYSSEAWTHSDERAARSERMATTMQHYRDHLTDQERAALSEKASETTRSHHAQSDSTTASRAAEQFGDARSKYHAERQERIQQQNPNESDLKVAAGAQKGLQKSWQQKRDKTRARACAVFQVLQVKRLLETEVATLGSKDLQNRQKLDELRDWLREQPPSATMPTNLRKFIHRIAQFYDAAEGLDGVRFEGDGGPDLDDFPYDTKDHPFVFI